MTTQSPGQPYSPDGKFWWDGTGWRPVDAAPSGPAPGQPGPAQFQPPFGPAGQSPAGFGKPPGAFSPSGSGRPPGAPPGRPGFPGPAGPGFPPPRSAVPRRPSRAGFVMALIGTLVVTALVGGLVGMISGRLSTEPAGSDTPPPLAAGFPNGERQYMKGVTLDLVVEDWMKRANSWKCTDEEAEPNNFIRAKRRTECTNPKDEDREIRVIIEYDAEDKIRLVESDCRAGLKSEGCTTTAASLADTVLAPQGKQLRDQAAKWAKENVDSERGTTIGGIRLQASLQPSHSMIATPAV